MSVAISPAISVSLRDRIQKKLICVVMCFLFSGFAMPLRAQDAAHYGNGAADGTDAEAVVQEASAPSHVSAYIGMRLPDLVERLGLPQSVYSSRGREPWQDDVVFVYREAEFFIFRDRVWQLSLKSAYGVTVGDPKPAVVLALGEELIDEGDCVLFPLPPVGWPLMFRANLSAAGRVSAIYIYRPDL